MRTTFLLSVALVAGSSLAAFAVEDDKTEPPKPTSTTIVCTGGQIWEEESRTCVDPQDTRLDDDTRYQAAREFAYAGRYDAATQALGAMSDRNDDRVLTYLGFVNRKAGRIETGMAYYDAALRQNPDNLLARSYMGQGLVDQGEITLATVQLTEIIARGGAGSWAELALRQAIGGGGTYSN